MSVGKIQMLDGLVSTHCTKKPILNINFLDKERWGFSNLLPFSIVIFQQIPFFNLEKKTFCFQILSGKFFGRNFWLSSKIELTLRNLFRIISTTPCRICLSVRPFIRASVRTLTNKTLYVTGYSHHAECHCANCPPVRPSVRPSVCPSVWQSVCLFLEMYGKRQGWQRPVCWTKL